MALLTLLQQAVFIATDTDYRKWLAKKATEPFKLMQTVRVNLGGGLGWVVGTIFEIRSRDDEEPRYRVRVNVGGRAREANVNADWLRKRSIRMPREWADAFAEAAGYPTQSGDKTSEVRKLCDGVSLAQPTPTLFA